MHASPSLKIGRGCRRVFWPSLLAIFLVSMNGALAQGTSTATNVAPAPPTYLRDILPIFMGKCSRCHNEQTRFVYNWLDYKTAYTDRGEIKRRLWDSWKGSYYKESMPIANSPESLAITEEERIIIRKLGDGRGAFAECRRRLAQSNPRPRKLNLEGVCLHQSARRAIRSRAGEFQTSFHLWLDQIF